MTNDRLNLLSAERIYTMKINRRSSVLIKVIYFLLTFLLHLNTASALAAEDRLEVTSARLHLTLAEKAWLKSHPKVTFSVPTTAPPLYFLDDQGEFAGINIDYMRLLAKRVGITMEFKGHATWSGAIEDAKKHIVDGIPNADATEDRKPYLNFTDIYSTFPQVIVAREDYDLISRFEDVSEKRIAVKSSSSRVYLLKDQYPESIIVEVDHIEEGLDLLVARKVDALYADLAQVDVLLTSKFYANIKYAVVAETPPVGLARIGLRNDEPILLKIFNKAIATITREEHFAIKKRWLPIGMPALEQKIELTAKERAWLKEHPVIRVGADPDWGPIEFLGDDGSYQGFSIDLIHRLMPKLGVRFEFVRENWQELIALAKQGQLDLFSCVAKTSVRDEYLLFTETYIQMAAGLFAKEGVAYISDLNSLIDKKVAVVEGYAIHDYLVDEFPKLKLLLVKNPIEGIRAVLDGDAFVYVDNVITTGYLISQKGYLQINLVGEVPFKFAQRMGVRKDWPILRDILQKAINNIPASERNALYNQWVPLIHEKPVDYSMFWKVGAGFVIFICFIVFWNRRLHYQVEKKTAEITSNEKRLKAIFNHRFQLTGLLSPDGKLLMANENVCRFVDVDFNKIEGNYLWELPHWSHSTELQRQIQDCVESAQKGNLVNIETTHPDSEGNIHYIDFYLTPVIDEKGEVIFLVPEGHDITTRKQHENEQRKLENQLQQAQKMDAIGTLAGGIAHDFNNILSSVLGYTELLMESPKKEHVSEYLSNIMKAGNRAKDLVKQILTFSRQTEHELKPVSVKIIVKEALKLLRASIPSSIEIKQNIRSDALVMGDPTQIHQIVMNLCTNAGHAMQKNGGILTVDCSDVMADDDLNPHLSDLKPGRYLNLTISDTGHGMSPVVLDQIFNPFFSTKERGEGTGLGLSVVHGIVNSYGGKIYAKSESGTGTTFQVILPTIKSTSEYRVEFEKSAPHGEGRILFVDDEPDIVDIGRQLLENLGYQVVTCTNSLEALELFREQPQRFDLVITDMTMPKMTGDKLATEILSTRKDIPVILCTGLVNPIVEETIKMLGIKGILMKPILRVELASTVRRVLDEAKEAT